MYLLNENKVSLIASQLEFKKPDAAGVTVSFTMLYQLYVLKAKNKYLGEKSVTIFEVNICVKNTHGRI